jgi:hypothetical protein
LFKVSKSILIICVIIITAFRAIACNCESLKPITTELLKQYNVVFYGKADSVLQCGKDGISSVYFSIQQLYKGNCSKSVKVDFDCASECLMSFEKGEEWIIYAKYQRFDLLTVSLCEHSRKKFINSKEDFYALDAKRSFEKELDFLQTELGNKDFIKRNQLYQLQNDFKPHNEQPSAFSKLLLLSVSLLAMGIVFFIVKKKKGP